MPFVFWGRGSETGASPSRPKLEDVTLGGTKKHQLLKFKVCHILSHSYGHEKLRTVFVFVLAHLEGPPQTYAVYNGDIGGKISKIDF